MTLKEKIMQLKSQKPFLNVLSKPTAKKEWLLPISLEVVVLRLPLQTD